MENTNQTNFTDMAPSDGVHDASASVGNNDGNLPDPEEIEMEDITVPLADEEEQVDEEQEDLTVYDE